MAAAIGLMLPTARAVPYASGVTNNAGTVSFVLNEPAGNVTVEFDGGASNLDMGALTNGTHSFQTGTAASFRIVVKKNAPLAWTQIGTDTTLSRFFSARGVAVNTNPATPLFGRIYVANAVSGTTATGARQTGDGLYLLNADRTDALGRGNTASTGGLNFSPAPAAQDGNSPWRIEIGPDNRVYIADFSTNFGTIYRTDADVTTGEQVLAGNGQIGPNAQITIHTTIGGSPIVKGSLETGDLSIYAIDGAMSGNLNRLMRWDIGAGPLPWATAPVPVAVPSPLLGANANVTTDNDIGPDGKLYVMQNRSGGAEVGVAVLVTNESGSGTTTVFNSLTESRSISNNPTGTDILRISRAIKVSPDGKRLAVIRDDNQTWILPLTNGIPNMARRELIATFSSTANFGRDVTWDAAGNLYVVSSGAELLRVWSPGGDTTMITTSDGQFIPFVVELPEVSVAVTDDLASEAGPDTGSFTFTRTGSTANPLTATYTLTGTASNGTDYQTNELSVTFGAGESTATVTITPIDDSVAERAETVVLQIVASTNYVNASPGGFTVSITDNETPEINIFLADSLCYERLVNDVITYRIERFGLTNSQLFVTYLEGGTALFGQDFLGVGGQTLPTAILLEAGEVSKTLSVEPVNDFEFEGNETLTLTVVQNFEDYVVGPSNSASGIIVDDESAPGLVLFADDFDVDSSANWTARFGANNNIFDADVRWAFDYSTLVPPIPPAPSSSGTTLGLFVQLNRTNAAANGAAGINLYPGRTFTGNFALRADMYLSYETAPAGSTEHALLGLNHSGLFTNRFTITTGDTSQNAFGGDGIWAAIGTDGSNTRDWVAYYATNANTVPHLYTNRSAASVGSVISAPPYAVAGSIGNRSASATKSWADVELSQSNNVVTLKVNRSIIYSFPNPSGFTSGDIMIGHVDSADSIGSRTNFVIFDNVRVVTYDLQITSIEPGVGNLLEINFAGPGQLAEFRLDSTPTLSPLEWAEEAGAIFSATPEGFRCTVPKVGDTRFYRIRR